MAANPIVLVNGCLDTDPAWKAILCQKDPFVTLSLRNASAGPWSPNAQITEEETVMAFKAAWVFSSRLVAFDRVVWPANPTLVWTMMEVFCPSVHDVRFLDTPRADANIIRIMYACLPLSASLPGLTQQVYTALINEMHLAVSWPSATVGVNIPAVITGGVPATRDMAGALGILFVMTRSSAQLDQRPMEVLVSSLCALAKRGTVSTGFINKISTGITQDTGAAITLDADTISACWMIMQHHVTDTTVGAVITRWLGFLPTTALRLQITLDQIPGEGLTCIYTIIKAYQDFRGFSWHILQYNFPTQFQSVQVAILAITNEPYYGYRKNLGPAKAANFRELGYVAQQLLIKAGGEGPLRRARCFTRTPKLQGWLDQLIDDFTDNQIALDTPVGYQFPNGIHQTIVGFNVPGNPPPPPPPGPNPPGPPGAGLGGNQGQNAGQQQQPAGGIPNPGPQAAPPPQPNNP